MTLRRATTTPFLLIPVASRAGEKAAVVSQKDLAWFDRHPLAF